MWTSCYKVAYSFVACDFAARPVWTWLYLDVLVSVRRMLFTFASYASCHGRGTEDMARNQSYVWLFLPCLYPTVARIGRSTCEQILPRKVSDSDRNIKVKDVIDYDVGF